MPFLVKADLALTILTEELNEITRSDDTLVTAALATAIGEMRTYLHDSYDVDVIFAAVGTARHPLLLQFGADLAVYYLVGRSQAGQQIDDRKARYDRAITWLKAARDSETYSDLPRRAPDTAQRHISWGSRPKRTNGY